MKGFVLFAALTIISTSAMADTPYLVDRQTGKYLGNLSANRYDLDSTSNPYGQFGSKYSPDSARNPHASNPPAVMHGGSRGGLGGLPGLPGLRGLGD